MLEKIWVDVRFEKTRTEKREEKEGGTNLHL